MRELNKGEENRRERERERGKRRKMKERERKGREATNLRYVLSRETSV